MSWGSRVMETPHPWHYHDLWKRKETGRITEPFLASEKNVRHHVHLLFLARVSNVSLSNGKGPGDVSAR